MNKAPGLDTTVDILLLAFEYSEPLDDTIRAVWKDIAFFSSVDFCSALAYFATKGFNYISPSVKLCRLENVTGASIDMG